VKRNKRGGLAPLKKRKSAFYMAVRNSGKNYKLKVCHETKRNFLINRTASLFKVFGGRVYRIGVGTITSYPLKPNWTSRNHTPKSKLCLDIDFADYPDRITRSRPDGYEALQATVGELRGFSKRMPNIPVMGPSQVPSGLKAGELGVLAAPSRHQYRKSAMMPGGGYTIAMMAALGSMHRTGLSAMMDRIEPPEGATCAGCTFKHDMKFIPEGNPDFGNHCYLFRDAPDDNICGQWRSQQRKEAERDAMRNRMAKVYRDPASGSQ